MQTDPVGYDDGINWYLYCNNNPLGWMDPSELYKIRFDDCDTCGPMMFDSNEPNDLISDYSFYVYSISSRKIDPIGYYDDKSKLKPYQKSLVIAREPFSCTVCIFICLPAVGAACTAICSEDPIWDDPCDTFSDCWNKCFRAVLYPPEGSGIVLPGVSIGCKIACLICFVPPRGFKPSGITSVGSGIKHRKKEYIWSREN